LELEEVGGPNDYIYWKLDQCGMQFAIHDAQKFASYAYPARPDSNVTHLYFHIESQSKFLEHLSQFNVTPYLLDEVVITVIDPDGRKVLFGTA
jgi:hypothetical protein